MTLREQLQAIKEKSRERLPEEVKRIYRPAKPSPTITPPRTGRCTVDIASL